jgi:hypothetical protein
MAKQELHAENAEDSFAHQYEHDPNACSICLEQVDYRGSILLTCIKCQVKVHAKCYNAVITTDDSKWLCEVCEEMENTGGNSKKKSLSRPCCAICPFEGGALRKTTQPGVWCHVLCANWIPELHHIMVEQNVHEPIDISLLDQSRSSLRCLVCGLRGGCIQCVSGRCARSFHVLCAMRAPSDAIYTGYHDDQQIYHCKAHLSDVASRKYEIVDNSWRQKEVTAKVLAKFPAQKGKCRFCNAKVPSNVLPRHEDFCLLSAMSKEEAKERKERIAKSGIEPVQIIYKSKATTSMPNTPTAMASANTNHMELLLTALQNNGGMDSPAVAATVTPLSSSTKNSRSDTKMRPCPECDTPVKEARLVNHLKTKCPKSKAAAARRAKIFQRRKNTSAPVQIELNENDDSDDVTEISAPLSEDMTDVLFASWPGQQTGTPMNSSLFWKFVQGGFFSGIPNGTKKRLDHMCKTLCGVKVDEILTRHEEGKLKSCEDIFHFQEEDNSEKEHNKLIMDTHIHSCDFMLEASKLHCPEDQESKPLIEIQYNKKAIVKPKGKKSVSSSSDLQGQINVLFENAENVQALCKYSLYLRRQKEGGRGRLQPPPQDEESDKSSVWSRFHPHSSLYQVTGEAIEERVISLSKGDLLWTSLDSFDQKYTPSSSNLPRKDLWQDEITPEMNILISKLGQQMKDNRFRIRHLQKQLIMNEHHEGTFKRHSTITESYYREYSWWKGICGTLLTGFKDPLVLKAEKEAAEALALENQLKAVAQPEVDTSLSEKSEDTVDDGTCVVCFDGQSPESNPIIFCDRCDLAVHQKCYGIVKVPSNDFYCDRCSAETAGVDPARSVYCQLCPYRDGAFKRTVDNKWIHVACALWCPGVWISNLNHLTGISLSSQTDRKPRFVNTAEEVSQLITPTEAQDEIQLPAKLATPSSSLIQLGSICKFCKIACGRTIKCNGAVDCEESFHPLCAWYNGLSMFVKLNKEKGYIYNGGGDGLIFHACCEKHLPPAFEAEDLNNERIRRRRFRRDTFYHTLCRPKPPPNRRSDKSTSKLLAGPILQAIMSTDGKGPANEFPSKYEKTDEEQCASCFQRMSLLNEQEDETLVNGRQIMIRCHYCNVFIHPDCCSRGLDLEMLVKYNSTWSCERCAMTGRKNTSTGCLLCERTDGYLIPCVKSYDEANKSLAGNFNNLWIHAFCAQWSKATFTLLEGLKCAVLPPTLSGDISMRCELCGKRSVSIFLFLSFSLKTNRTDTFR